MKQIKASEFKAKCLRLLDEVAESGEVLVITKNGRAVAEVGPAKRRPKTLFGAHKGMFEIKGDIIEPVDVEWEAMKE
jgi:prevent-host-death family protein